MEWLLTPEALLGLGIPLLIWVVKQCNDILGKLDSALAGTAKINSRLDLLNGKVATNVNQINELEKQAAWVRGKLNEPYTKEN